MKPLEPFSCKSCMALYCAKCTFNTPKCVHQECDTEKLEVQLYSYTENKSLRLLKNYRVAHSCLSETPSEESTQYPLFEFLQHYNEDCSSLTFCKLC
jgi:hypothetical protein